MADKPLQIWENHTPNRVGELRFRIVETIGTFDGPRTRISNIGFSTMEAAREFVKEQERNTK
ncbi:MAG TPA: hypothetical protein DCX26_03725 [Pseudomonas sp.]|jgi:hypothetical protein|nr:MAG: hypothetical protein GOVbin7759_37 [Prokaryotic dsDNA virus sp.]HAW61424.1 hypothetical protein [Pseudomonas sp.]|tara:strand:+ start:18466 stop:18651 length:186 start_codon:yes stop_codon:yes gene_type:complete